MRHLQMSSLLIFRITHSRQNNHMFLEDRDEIEGIMRNNSVKLF